MNFQMLVPAPLPGELPMVLVVDGQPENLPMMAELLRGRFRARIAATGEEALRSPPAPSPI